LSIINNHLSIIRGEVLFLNAMKKSKSSSSCLERSRKIGRLNNEVRRNSADKATAFHRSSLREKALPQNACRPKNSVNLCESVKSVVNFPSCLSAFVAEIQSIKNNKLCETKPISEMPKMVVTAVYTMTNNKKQRTINYSKQSQTNPIYSVFIRVHSWLNSKQTQMPLGMAYATKPNFGLFNFPVFPYNRTIDLI